MNTRNMMGILILSTLLAACGAGQERGRGTVPGASTAPVQKAAVVLGVPSGPDGQAQTAAISASCGAVTWTAGINYPLGTIVLYSPNGLFYKVVQVAGNGSDATIPTISTWYWAQTSCGTPSAGKIVAGYYPNWTPAPLRVRDVNAR